MPRFRSVFLDRDGILNRYLPGKYVRSPEELVVPAGVAQAIRRLNDAGLKTVIISNQQGVGKGLMTPSDLANVQSALEAELMAQAGARIDACYYCTDLASANSPRRKPGPGMLFEAASDLNLDLSQTAFIGDSQSDIAAGCAAGVGATILVLSGATAGGSEDSFDPKPDRVFADLETAVSWVLEGYQT
jgi:D-glycero-D-manno-heptose 1,7-bisphosphate phosphatase